VPALLQQPGWRQKIASLITAVEGKITRVDLALDFFDGLTGGMDRIRSDYMHGAMDHWGKRPKCNLVGDWCNGVARSFYIGSKEAGKQTNVYEKGHQLFGNSSGNPWIRAELRYGNKLRVLPVDVLTRPDDFLQARLLGMSPCFLRHPSSSEHLATSNRNQLRLRHVLRLRRSRLNVLALLVGP